MPRVRWGIDSSVIDDFDRSTQYTPYMGAIPPNSVYQWRIKRLQSIAPTSETLPQLRVGLELVPRNKGEKQYKGYFLMAFLNIGPKNNMFWVPFCDALGVSGTDFTDRTVADPEGNVQRIGRWRNTGKELILAQVKDGADQRGTPRKEIGWMGPLSAAPVDDEIDDDDDNEEYDGDDEEFDDEEYETEEAPKVRSTSERSTRRGAVTKSRSTTRARHRLHEEDPF